VHVVRRYRLPISTLSRFNRQISVAAMVRRRYEIVVALARTVSVSRQATHSTGRLSPGGMQYAPSVIDRPNFKE
jgi:hypothetical protein